QFGVALTDEPKRVLVEPQEDVQTVLFDPRGDLPVATAGALAAEAPADLVDGDRVLLVPARLVGDVPDRGQRADAAAENGDLLAPRRAGARVRHLKVWRKQWVPPAIDR